MNCLMNSNRFILVQSNLDPLRRVFILCMVSRA
nr:MAG TPA: hypothetical protein [Caudoviricetes sp.]